MTKRQPPKAGTSKAALYEMLAEAVRNTQPQPQPEPMGKTRPAPKRTAKIKRVRG
jgi:hypothetical protein